MSWHTIGTLHWEVTPPLRRSAVGTLDHWVDFSGQAFSNSNEPEIRIDILKPECCSRQARGSLLSAPWSCCNSRGFRRLLPLNAAGLRCRVSAPFSHGLGCARAASTFSTRLDISCRATSNVLYSGRRPTSIRLLTEGLYPNLPEDGLTLIDR
jgi:hypothetical protein